MIMSGWILPDYTEIMCKSYANNKEHIKIVEKYLNNLRLEDEKTYEQILKISNKLNIPNEALDDIAVKVLGWTKVNNEPYKVIYYLHGTLFENVIIRYMNLGYTLVPIYNIHPIKINNPSMYL